MRRSLAASIVLLLAACSSTPEKTSGKNGTSNNTATTNNTQTVGPNNTVGSDQSVFSVTLRMTNATDTTAYLVDNCGPDWLDVLDGNGNGVRLSAGCASCECGVESCAVCGACAPPEAVPFESGSSLEYTWDGRFHFTSSDEFRDSCSDQRFFSDGDFRARFCFGWTFEAQPGGDVVDVSCEEFEFTLGTDSLVEYVIDEAPEVQDPACAAADSNGFFPNCDVCGADCDSIDAPGANGNACGCSGGCPCGLRCGSYEIAPNVVVSDICVR